MAAASCTHQPPASYPAKAETCPFSSSRSDPLGITRPSGTTAPSRSVRSSGGTPACTASIAATTSRP